MERKTSTNSAQNLRGTLRRIGQGSKWNSQAPVKTAVRSDDKGNGSGVVDRRASVSSDRHMDGQRWPTGKQNQQLGFRLRARNLQTYLIAATRDVEAQARSSRTSPAEIDALIAKALAHFEDEMKALRVMIKAKDVLVDPDNAWRSASRIKAPCNAAIRLCLQAGRHERAFKLLNQMKKDGIFPSASTFTIFISGLNRALLHQQQLSTADSSASAAPEPKLVQRTRDLCQELETLWKQAFPRYFQRSGALKSKDALGLEQDNFHALTDQARRNLISQQASIHEAREFPKTLTHAIGAYIVFLRFTNANEELGRLFDRLFPPTLIDRAAKGLAPDASPQDKLELANHKLSETLPLGDVTTFSSFLAALNEAKGPDGLTEVERVWTRLVKLMDLERHERLSTNRASSRDKEVVFANGDQSQAARFVPDDQFLEHIFTRLHPRYNEATQGLHFGLSVLSKVYGLDLESAADGIVRDPHSSEYSQATGIQRYLRRDVDSVDGLGRPVASLRDPTTALAALNMLARPETWKQFVALFNYLWAQAHADYQHASRQTKNVGNLLSDTAVFGSTLQPSAAVKLLWLLADAGDPVGSRVIIDAMKRAAEASASGSRAAQDAAKTRARRTKLAAGHSGRSEVELWKPAELCYIRAMRANLTAALNGPGGLTAATLEGASPGADHPQKGAYDAWSTAKSLFTEWYDQKGADSRIERATARWDADNACVEDRAGDTASRSRDGITRETRADKLASIHADNMRSLFLHVAQVCAIAQGERNANVAREALSMLQERVGLEAIINDTKKLKGDVVATYKSSSTTGVVVPLAKVRTLKHLGKVISLALDTSEHSFAPKEDVELWKRIRGMLHASFESSESTAASQNGAREARSPGNNREARSRHAGGNRLLLSRDDYLELEAEASAEADDEDAWESGEAARNPRSSYRMQRRSRHVEQELERWVRGAAT